jgi:hypothetical protein
MARGLMTVASVRAVSEVLEMGFKQLRVLQVSTF